MKKLTAVLAVLVAASPVFAQSIELGTNAIVTRITSVVVQSVRIDMVMANKTNDLIHPVVTAGYRNMDANGNPVSGGQTMLNRTQLLAAAAPLGINVDQMIAGISAITRNMVLTAATNTVPQMSQRLAPRAPAPVKAK